ncbi:ROK family transcriptional regulator [Microbacterium sp.]|uniref:ROK family transcriptional regulator n=1 Tax=Microbacterium sp. TaxID=51671 RepID=UPI003A8A32E7
MTRRGANQPSVGGYNEALVLDQVRRSGGLSRVELAGKTGLSSQTVSNITQRLLDAGIIEPGGRVAGRGLPAGPGKPRTILRLVPTSRYAIGVHLDPSVLTVALLAIDGTVVTSRSRATPSANDPTRTIHLITQQIDLLLDDTGVYRDRIVGIGIAAPGPIDAERGVIVDPPNLDGWHRVPLRDAIAERTGLPVALDKDVTAAAVAELWLAADTTTTNFVFLYLGTGVGMGLVIDGEVARGSSGNAGEVGHIVVDPDGPPCPCGQRGCVAVSCTPAALVEEAESLGILPGARTRRDPATMDAAFSSLVDLAAAQHPGAAGVLTRCGQRITHALAVVCDLLDVDRVIVGGPLWGRLSTWFEHHVFDSLGAQLVTRDIHPIVVTGTTLGKDVGAIGAASIILDEALAPRPTSLLLT